MPIFNEEASTSRVIESIKDELNGVLPEHEILVINDGSTDCTGELLKNIGGIRVITHDKNKGYGAALKTGGDQAAGDKILIMDADYSYPASQIRQMLELSKTYDMVVGARKSPFIPNYLFRGVMRYLFKVTASIILRTWIPDLNSGMRVYDTALFRRYRDLLPDGFSASSTLTAIFIKKGHSIRYLDIPYRTRIGISKLKVFRDATLFIYHLITTLRKM